MEAPRDSGFDSEAKQGWRAADEATLLDGMRRRADAAFAEFLARFHAMLIAIARRRGLTRSEAETVAVEFLDAAALRLAATPTRIPNSLTAYLLVSFQQRLRLDWRTARRRDLLDRKIATEIGRGTQSAIAETCSQYVVRLTSGDGGESDDEELDPRERTSLRKRLALAIDECLDDDERVLLGYLADRMPQREIAEIFGIKHGSVRMRIQRLRARLVQIAIDYINTLPTEESILLAQFLDRPPRRLIRDGQRARPPDHDPQATTRRHPRRDADSVEDRGADHE